MYQGNRYNHRERRSVHQGNWLVFIVISLVLVGFIVVGNIFLLVSHDARDRVVHATVSELPRAIGVVAQQSSENVDALHAFVDYIKQTNKSVLLLDVVFIHDGEYLLKASATTHVATQTPANIPGDATLVAQAIPNNVAIVTDDSRAHASYAFTNTEGVVIGYVEMLFNTSTITAPLDRNLERASKVLIIILIITVLILFWFLGTRQYVRMWRHAKRQVTVHDEAISNIVHEMQTPITILQGYIAMLSSEVAVFSKAQRYLERIEKTSNQLESFVDNIQTALLIERGYIQMSPEKINPAVVVQDVVDTIIRKNYNTKIEIKHEIQASAPIFVDRALLKKALLHIVKNALQYTEAGIVRVLITTEGGDVLIRVEDSGVGMTKEQQERIFDKWYRAQYVMKDGVRGSGLGLWIAQSLIRSMKGRIHVVSDEGVGTTITLRFAMVA